MFGDIFHAITFGFFKKKDEQAVPAAAAPAPAPAPAPTGAPPAAATGVLVKPVTVDPLKKNEEIPKLNSSSDGDDIQNGGGRRRRRGSPKNRSKSKNGGSSMGFGRVGGKNKRSSRKKTTYKRCK